MDKRIREPAVYIYERNASHEALIEICAGLEEEGVPYAVYKMEENDVNHLAYNAANQSPLNVGIGITSSEAALQIENCRIENPVFHIQIEPNYCRRLGINGARAVKGGVFI